MKVVYWRRGTALLSVLGLLLLSGCSGSDQDEYRTVQPDTGPVEYRVEDTGTVTYADNYTIVPTVSGTVTECTFQEGDTVTAGQTLYTIDSDALEDQIVQAQLSVDSAQVALEQTVASLGQAKVSLSQAQAACADLTVASHASGSVTAVNVHVGDFISSGTPVAQVVDSVNLKLTVPFALEDAKALTPGAAAVISFPGKADTLTGTVVRVYDTPVALSGSRTGVNVEFSFRNPGTLASGSTAMASVNGVMCMEAGTISYTTEQSIYAGQSGQVLTLSIQEGETVTAGQTVLTLKNDSLTNAVDNAQLQVDNAQLQVDAAQVQVDSAQASLDQLTDQREDYTITAPADGVILSRTSKEGDLASAGSPMAVLAQPEALCVHASIDEQYIDRVGTGQSVSITFTTDTGEQRTYTGSVRRVEDTGVTSGGVTDYTVEIALDNTDGLRDGMNVSVSILTEGKENCLRVPVKAVDGDTVQVLRNGKTETVTVETGLWGSDYVEILSGIAEEDTIVLP